MPHSRVTEPSHEELLRIYALPKTIAVIGASTAVGKPAHDIPRYLQSQGYRIVPVNPRGGEILGARAFPSLRDVDLPIDVVDVLRPPQEAEAVARDAVAIGAKILWFQPGTDSGEAVLAVANSGITIVTGRCMGVTHGLLGLARDRTREGDDYRRRRPCPVISDRGPLALFLGSAFAAPPVKLTVSRHSPMSMT